MKTALFALAAFIYIVKFTDVTNAGILIPRRGVLTQHRRSWEDVENVNSQEEHSDSHQTQSKEIELSVKAEHWAPLGDDELQPQNEIPEDTTFNSNEEGNKPENEELVPKDRDERNVSETEEQGDAQICLDEAVYDKETQDHPISTQTQEDDVGTSGEDLLIESEQQQRHTDTV